MEHLLFRGHGWSCSAFGHRGAHGERVRVFVVFALHEHDLSLGLTGLFEAADELGLHLGLGQQTRFLELTLAS